MNVVAKGVTTSAKYIQAAAKDDYLGVISLIYKKYTSPIRESKNHVRMVYLVISICIASS